MKLKKIERLVRSDARAIYQARSLANRLGKDAKRVGGTSALATEVRTQWPRAVRSFASAASALEQMRRLQASLDEPTKQCQGDSKRLRQALNAYRRKGAKGPAVMKKLVKFAGAAQKVLDDAKKRERRLGSLARRVTSFSASRSWRAVQQALSSAARSVQKSWTKSHRSAKKICGVVAASKVRYDVRLVSRSGKTAKRKALAAKASAERACKKVRPAVAKRQGLHRVYLASVNKINKSGRGWQRAAKKLDKQERALKKAMAVLSATLKRCTSAQRKYMAADAASGLRFKSRSPSAHPRSIAWLVNTVRVFDCC